MIKYFLVLLSLVTFISSTEAQETIAVDLDAEEVKISTDFHGANLLLFGAFDRASVDDIAIIISGPPTKIALRRKENVSGIWLNTDSATLVNMPSFYHILSTRPLEDIATPSTMKVNRLSFEYFPFKPRGIKALSSSDEMKWQTGLIANMEKAGLWLNHTDGIKVVQDVLFRANIDLPANIIPGDYSVRTLHFRDGALVGETVSEILVIKSGLSAEIYRFAHEYAPIYGIFAIIFAMGCGWLAAAAFRKK